MNMNNNDDLLNEDGSIKLPNPFGVTPSLLPQQPNVLTGMGEDVLKRFESYRNLTGSEMTLPITEESLSLNYLNQPNNSALLVQPSSINSFESGYAAANLNPVSEAIDPLRMSVLLPNYAGLDEEKEKEREREEKEKTAKQQEEMAKDLEEIKKRSSERRDVYVYDPKKLIQDHALSESSYIRSFINKIENNEREMWLQWKCAFCGAFMFDSPRLDSYRALETLYKQFLDGIYETCTKCKSDNFFFVTSDTIVFNCIQSLTIDPTKTAGKKVDRTVES